MKAFALATLLAALCITQCLAAGDLPSCPPPGEGDIQLFPKPDNCSQYYECDNGKLLIMECPPGLEFNAANRTCDYPWSANCKVSRLVLVLQEEKEADLPDCPPPGEGDVQLFPKPDNCSQYYECDNGHPVVMECPPGLEFNAANDTCDYPWSANCKVSPVVLVLREKKEADLPDCPPPGEGDVQLFPKPDNCSQYYECDNGNPVVMECPPGLEFNAANDTCDYPWSANCKVSPVVLVLREEKEADLPDCPPPGEGDVQLFPKPDNCSQYYECDNGHPVVMECPPGLEFNAANDTCDYPWSANCKVSPVVLVLREEKEADLPDCPPPGEGDVQLFPKPDNCSQYYECDNGHPVVMECPPGLEFNAANDTCDYPWSANCKVSPVVLVLREEKEADLPDCPPPGEGDVQLFPKPDNCSQYYECDNGHPVVMECPPGLEFNAANDTCDYPWSANCQTSRVALVIKQAREDLPTCPPPGEGDIQLFPKPDNCSQYYECDNGKLLIMDCPPGLEFNAANRTCDYDWSANCKESRVIQIQHEGIKVHYRLPSVFLFDEILRKEELDEPHHK
ncbi:chondroitin proteoglycan 2-like [Anabrus simplex]|uniref:chondroitin proteoglycan 2-like n=1 Tax=Anabrus simplex TaxID=316456 RepID=UPI0035A2E6E8